MNVTIRTATLDDAAQLALLHRQCFEEGWNEAAFRNLLDRVGTFALLGSNAAATESQAFILTQAAAGESEILSIGTRSTARRSGLAGALLGEAASESMRLGAQEMFLEVAADNSAALALYGASGFTIVGRRRSYYLRAGGTGVDALMLRASLPLRGHGNEGASRLGWGLGAGRSPREPD